MLVDGLDLPGGDVVNLVIPKGNAFPDATVGELFYREDQDILYVYLQALGWTAVPAGTAQPADADLSAIAALEAK